MAVQHKTTFEGNPVLIDSPGRYNQKEINKYITEGKYLG